MIKSIHRFFAIILFVFLAAGCSSGGGDGGSNNGDSKATISRIEVSPTGMLLTEINDTEQLSAQAYDENDQIISDVVFTWSSNDTQTISVDSNGLTTAQSGLGSAQITAVAEGVKSPPVTALVALPVADAKLIDDAQVVVAPTLVDPNADLQLGLQFVTTLDGTTVPEVGDTIVGTGVHPIGGVVIASEVQGNGTVIITYETVSLDELFSSFLLEETYDFSSVPFDLGDKAALLYDMEDLGGGAVRLTLKPETSVAAISGAGTIRALKFNLGIFECEATAEPPFDLTANPGTIVLTSNSRLSLLFSVPARDPGILSFELLRLDVDVGADFEAKLNLETQLSAEVKCEALNLINRTIPLPGAAFLLSPTIALGPSVTLGGEIKTQDIGFVLTANAKAEGFLEFRCTPGVFLWSDCNMNADYDAPSPEAKYEINAPSPAAFFDLKIQPAISAGAVSTVNFGIPPKFKRINKFFGKLSLEAAKGSLGLKQTGDFALIKTQVLDDTYASNYKLIYEWEVKAGEDIEKVINKINKIPGINIPTSKSDEGDLATSPTATTAVADTDFFLTGDEVTFTVELDSGTTNYPFFNYNVDRIIIYRKNDSDDPDEIIGITATTDQTTFDITWRADTDGSISTEDFYAFVTTKALPVPYIGELELKKVTETIVKKCPEDYVLEPIGFNPYNDDWFGEWSGTVVTEGGNFSYTDVLARMDILDGPNSNSYTGDVTIGPIRDGGNASNYYFDVSGTILPPDQGGAVNLTFTMPSGAELPIVIIDTKGHSLVEQTMTLNGTLELDVMCIGGVGGIPYGSLIISGSHNWGGTYRLVRGARFVGVVPPG